MPTEVVSRIPEIVEDAEVRAHVAVSETVDEIAWGARRHLIEHGSYDESHEGLHLLDTIHADSEGFEGDVSAGDGLPDSRAVYVEFGTGTRGAAADFPGKPDWITYDMDWTVGIPKNRPTFAYLIPALEEEREVFEEKIGRLYR